MTARAATVLTLSYDGTPFHGYARQPGIETVQGRLEDALATVLGRTVETAVAGRTDAGVHALAQVVSFESAPGDPEPAALARSVSAIAGPHVAVTGVRTAVPGFSARFDALSREYRYRLVAGPVPPVHLRDRAWWAKRSLDLVAMRDAAGHLVGEHDYRSFCVTASADLASTERSIDLIDIRHECHLGEECVTIRIAGRSFLHSMVRIITGSLVLVGAGQRSPEWMSEALAACDRSAAGPTAPPQGLTLWRVIYPDDRWL